MNIKKLLFIIALGVLPFFAGGNLSAIDNPVSSNLISERGGGGHASRGGGDFGSAHHDNNFEGHHEDWNRNVNSGGNNYYFEGNGGSSYYNSGSPLPLPYNNNPSDASENQLYRELGG